MEAEVTLVSTRLGVEELNRSKNKFRTLSHKTRVGWATPARGAVGSGLYRCNGLVGMTQYIGN